MTKIQNFKMYINGLWVNSESGKTIETVNPENNEVWATVPEANEKDVDKAVKAAQNAFEKSWSNLHPRERAKYLRSLADQLRQNAEHLGTIETIDTGKIFRETKTLPCRTDGASPTVPSPSPSPASRASPAEPPVTALP